MPYVSVVMPAYNAEKTIELAMNSVLSQTYKDIELIVINDCSSDNTAEIIRRLAMDDDRVKILDNSKNSGVSATRNRGVLMATGRWIAFLDSDDMWRADKLEKQLSVLNDNIDAVLSYTASSFISNNGEPFSYVMEAIEHINYKTLLKKNLISCSSVVIRADVMKKIKMPSDSMHEDYYVWLNVVKEYGFACGINEPLLIYRLTSKSKSSNRFKSAKMLFNTYIAVGYSKLTSFLLTVRYSVHSVSKRYKIQTHDRRAK